MAARRSRWVVLTALVIGTLVPAAAASAGDVPGIPLQLEVGDSWTYGEGASDPATGGYAGLVYEENRASFDCLPAQPDLDLGCKHLQRLILARPATDTLPGVTTDSLIAEQLPIALESLEVRNGDANPRNDVEVVLITVGGNDVSGPVLAACLGGFSPHCVGVIKERLAHVETNLGRILGELRTAAGPEATIVIGTYDNAIRFCQLAVVPGAVSLGDVVLEGHPGVGIAGLNNVIESAAAAHGVAVADTYGRLGSPEQWVGGADCLHPSDAGHTVIAGIVDERITG